MFYKIWETAVQIFALSQYLRIDRKNFYVLIKINLKIHFYGLFTDFVRRINMPYIFETLQIWEIVLNAFYK